MEKTTPIETKFLKAFIKAIINKNARKHLVPIEFKSEEVRRKISQIDSAENKEEMNLEKERREPLKETLAIRTLERPLPRPQFIPIPIQNNNTQVKEETIIKKQVIRENQVQQKPIQKAPQPLPKLVSGLSQINTLLADPAVQSLECTGPGKPLLINRSGLVQATKFALSTEEINIFMQEISERTRIPLTQGLFKAFMGNIIFTAVISDIIGTRFVMQKRYLSQFQAQ